MATTSSVLAWEVPWTEEPGRLQSQRVGHDLATKPQLFARCSLMAQWVKNPPANIGDVGLIPGLGSSPGEENGNPLQCSCLENPMDRGAWQATVQWVTESDATE